MNAPVSDIRNLGPKSEAMFARAGITSAEELHEIGAEAAYLRLLRSGTRPHFIGFYALWLGLQGRPWTDLHPEEKAMLRKTFDALKARARASGDSPSHELKRALDTLGIRP